jgi:hypothetical protein
MFEKISERVEAIKASGVSEKNAALITDDNYKGETQRCLCENLRKNFSFDTIRELNEYCTKNNLKVDSINSIYDEFKVIKTAVAELDTNPDSKDEFDKVMVSQDKIMKLYAEVQTAVDSHKSENK